VLILFQLSLLLLWGKPHGVAKPVAVVGTFSADDLMWDRCLRRGIYGRLRGGSRVSCRRKIVLHGLQSARASRARGQWARAQGMRG
jgi:hypothetical protein